MKSRFLYIICICLLSACRRTDTSRREHVLPPACISFTDSIINMGVIPLRQAVDSAEFRFTNTGRGPLVILSVETSCHCTQADYDHRPIAAGDSSSVRVVYDGRGRAPEYFRKDIRVTSNAANQSIVTLTLEGWLK